MQDKKFGEKMSDWFRYVLSCCDSDEEAEEARPALQISGPTNFRREDITIPGLDPGQQRFIREKAISDATKMWSCLQPLTSLPSGHFASPTNPTAIILPSYEEFTTPRSPPATSRRVSSGGGGWDRVKAHSRKISNSLTKPLGYHAMESGNVAERVVEEEGGSKYEMRALMESGSMPGGAAALGKMSGESFSVSGSETGDRESGKEVGKV